MAYKVEFKPKAIEEISDIERVVAQRILEKTKWLSENVDAITPQPLTGELKGLFKLRVGDYRVIYSFSQEKNLLTVHLIGHRRDIYR